MNQLKPKRETPEIYAIGDQVAVWETQYGASEIIGIYPVVRITAREAILQMGSGWPIPLAKKPYDKRAGDAWSAMKSYKPAEQADFDAIEFKSERIKAANLIHQIRELPTKQLTLDVIKELNTALKNTIKSIEP